MRFLQRQFNRYIAILVLFLIASYIISSIGRFDKDQVEIAFGASGDIIFNDTFTEASDTLLENHTPDTGTSWTSVYLRDAKKIEVDSFSDVIDAGSNTEDLTEGQVLTADATYPSADYQVQVKANAVSSGGDNYNQLLTRYSAQANNGYYSIHLSDTTSEDPTIKKGASATTETDLVTHDNTDGTIFVNGDTIIFEAIGSDIAVYDVTGGGTRGGAEVAMLYVSNADVTAAGKAGVGFGAYWAATTGDMYDSDQELDDFVVYQVGGSNTGWTNPTTNGEISNDFTNPANAYASDNSDATVSFTTATPAQDYGDFGISIASGSTIRGISVRVESGADSVSPVYTIKIELSKDNGSTWPVSKTADYDFETTNTDQTFVFGHARSLWGTTWSPSDLTDANFRVRITIDQSGISTVVYQLDHISVRVVYDAESGAAAGEGNLEVKEIMQIKEYGQVK